MKSNRTRERILETSIKLFNEKKASNVSTVQISAAMQISPGNLYYYYANKEEIIRCIWKERMLKEIEDLIAKYGDIKTAGELLEFFRESLDHCFKYKFFYTEMPTLFVNDDSMLKLYREASGRVRAVSLKLYDSLMKAGKAAAYGEEVIKDIVDNGVVLFMGIVSCCDIAAGGVVTEDVVKTVWRRMISYLRPLLTDNMRKEISEELAARGVNRQE